MPITWELIVVVVVAFVGTIVATWASSRGRPIARALPAVALVAAFWLAMGLLIGRDLKLMSPATWQWLFWAAGAVGLVAVLDALLDLDHRPYGRRVLWPAVCVVVAVATALALGWVKANMPSRGWEAFEAIGWIGGAAVWIAGQAIVSRSRDATVPAVAWTITAVAASLALGLLGRSERLSLLMGVLAAGAAGLAVATVVWRPAKMSAAVWLVLAVCVSGLVLSSLDPWYSYLPVWDAVYVLNAPVVAIAAGRLTDPRRRWAGPLLAAAVTLAMLAMPLLRAVEAYRALQADGLVY